MTTLLASACSVLQAKPDPTRYFVLTATEPTTPPLPIPKAIGLDHVKLPEYLTRDEMVTRKASNQIDIQDYNRWGEPLKDGLVRTLRHDLEGQLGAERVLTPPFEPDHPPPLVVDLEVRRFEFVAGQGALIDVVWTLRDKAGAIITQHETKKVVPAPDQDVGLEVAALSKGVDALAKEIGDAVRGHHELALVEAHRK